MTSTTPIVDSRQRLLAEGLVPVSEAAAKVLGHPVSAGSVLRFSTAGRNGVRLTTIKGMRGRRLTSVQEFARFWLASSAEVEGDLPAPTLDAAEADKVLEAFGLGRCGDQ